MTYSNANKPDLDWSQVKETIKMLAVSVAQVEATMRLGEDSVDVLAKSFTSMVDDLNAVERLLAELQPVDPRESALQHCKDTQVKIHESIVAFQFYDRLRQCLGHVAEGLRSLSTIIDTPHRLYNPAEWQQLQQQIRDSYTMESEKIMFDAIQAGKSIDDALALMQNSAETGQDDDIELF